MDYIEKQTFSSFLWKLIIPQNVCPQIDAYQALILAFQSVG